MTKIEAYQKAIDAIDDYFEYRNESVEDRRIIQYILDTLTINLKELDNEPKL